MTRVTIIGVGLIGGSLGLALRRARQSGRRQFHVTGVGRTPKTLKEAKRLGAVDEFFTDSTRGVREADIVVLCTPVQFMRTLTEEILPFLKRDALITDVGSVKKSIVGQMALLLRARNDVHFVGAHPLAGSEKTGVRHADPDLFKGALCVVTPEKAPRDAVRKVTGLWRQAGARPLQMTSAQHDKFLAQTSHLPHVIAFALVSLVDKTARKNPVVRSLVAGSFRDMTRIAASDPLLWTGIFDFNRKELSKAAQEIIRLLRTLVKRPGPSLVKTLSQLSKARQNWPS